MTTPKDHLELLHINMDSLIRFLAPVQRAGLTDHQVRETVHRYCQRVMGEALVRLADVEHIHELLAARGGPRDAGSTGETGAAELRLEVERLRLENARMGVEVERLRLDLERAGLETARVEVERARLEAVAANRAAGFGQRQ